MALEIDGRLQMGSMEPSQLYDAYYFAHGCGPPYERNEEWLYLFASIADRILTDIHPTTVLDTGCAMGFLVEALRQRGVEAYGVDISEYAIQRVDPSIKPYCWVGSVLDPFPQQYDLLVCIEVLEHLPPLKADETIKNCCLHGNDVLFSSTPFDYKELTHLNVQPPEYWAELFARYGFFRDVDFDASFISPWAVRFRHKNEPFQSIVRAYERKFWLLWKENVDLRESKLQVRHQLASNEQTIQMLNEEIRLKDQRLQEMDRIANAANNHLREIHKTLGWQLMQRAYQICFRLAPPGSHRERWLQAWMRALLKLRSKSS